MAVENIDKQDSPTFRIIMIIILVMVSATLLSLTQSISKIETRVESIAAEKVAKEEFKQLESRLAEIHKDIREIRNNQNK